MDGVDYRPLKEARSKFVSAEFRFDVQLLIEGENIPDEEAIEYITSNIKGDSLFFVGEDNLRKIHYHTNEPWQLLEYCSTLGDIFDLVVENMERQGHGLRG